MTRAKAAATALLNTWKFQKGDTVMIARGRNKGRVATITGIVRSGNCVTGRRRAIPQHKKDRWRTNPKVFLDGKANAGRRVLRGNKSVDTDRPVPISNICHVAQRNDTSGKSQYKCVRVEFFEMDSVKHRVLKSDTDDRLTPKWKKKQRPPPRTKRIPSAKFASADIAHQRTYFPPANLGPNMAGQSPGLSQRSAMYHAPAAKHFSTFASQVRQAQSVDCALSGGVSPAQSSQLSRGSSAASAGQVWDQLMQLQEEEAGTMQGRSL